MSDRGKQPDVKQMIRFGINRSVPTVALVIHPDYGLVDCDVIRAAALSGLYIGLLNPILGGGATPIDTLAGEI